MTENILSMKPGDKIKILGENGEWHFAKMASSASAERSEIFEYPTTARRAFVALAEAVRTINDGKGARNMLNAIAGLHMAEEDRMVVLRTYLANTPLADLGPVHRQSLAESLARLLEGREKFDGARFVHHATSDSTEDNDSDEGKWSFNRLHQAEAQKTTIESVPDDGDGETVTLG